MDNIIFTCSDGALTWMKPNILKISNFGTSGMTTFVYHLIDSFAGQIGV